MRRRSSGRSIRVVAVVGVVSVLALGACGSSGGRSRSGSSSTTRRATTTTSTTTSTSTSSPTAPPSTTAPCSFSGTTARALQTATVADAFRLRSVSVRTAGCTDTITFGFVSANPAARPPYEIELVSPPFAQAGSGAPITLPGRTFLKVKFSPAWTYDLQTGVATYTGPQRIEPSAGAVTRAMVLSDAYEGVVTWIIGMDGPGRYQVTSAASPASVTVTVGG